MPAAPATTSRRLSEAPREVARAADPVAAVFEAHRDGVPVALSTSGTSGSPRSVVRTTESWFGSFGHVSSLLEVNEHAHVVVPGPLTATMNLFSAVHARWAGARLTLGELPVPVAPATHLVLTPAALARAVSAGTDLGGVHVLVAGDRLPPALRVRALESGATRVSHYYGAAELSFVAWGGHADDLWPFPGTEVERRGEEIWVRSPYLFAGYAGGPGPARWDADGFVTVGDRGRLVDGRLLLRGRGTGTVVTGGATVHTAEVEDVLREALGRDVLVVGVPHPDLGEVLCGVLTSDADDADLTELRRAGDRLLAASHRPRRWFVVPAPPLTVASKLDRGRLAAMLAAPDGDVRRLT